MSVTITEEFIMSGARVGPRQSGWKARQLEIIGEPWPPKHGWKKRAIGRVISDVEAIEFRLLKEFRGGNRNGQLVKMAHQAALQRIADYQPAESAGTGEPPRREAENPMNTRLKISSRVLAALLSNPAVVQQNGMTGWGPANCDYEQLCSLAVELSDSLMKAERDFGIKVEKP